MSLTIAADFTGHLFSFHPDRRRFSFICGYAAPASRPSALIAVASRRAFTPVGVLLFIFVRFIVAFDVVRSTRQFRPSENRILCYCGFAMLLARRGHKPVRNVRMHSVPLS